VINQRFVVGFMGSVESGAAIFADLERRFGHSNRAPSISEISHALEAINVQFNGRATIIGWTRAHDVSGGQLVRVRLRCT
jgi:hypothetical protein